MSDWFLPRGSRAEGPWETVVDDRIPGWRHTGLRVATLSGSEVDLAAGPLERMVVPLSGFFTVRTDDGELELQGRASVFDGPADVAYLGTGTAATVRGHGRVAVAEAPADERLPAARIARADVPIELRGAGASSREVRNFGVPGVLDAAKLIVCEVVTPAGNWSSWPAHKHDETTPTESRLEEIYYFEVAEERGRRPEREPDPFGLFATYSSPAGSIDLTAVVRTGDVALVPHGYHGPAAAAPGYDLYYLNVMAGPDLERAWRITDDPAHAWLRGTWNDERPDPRLPYGAKERRE